MAELHGNRRPSPAPQLTAVAASCIDYARWPLSRQASWARAEAYWIIDVLTLASQSRGQSSKESAREQTLETEANCHTSSASCGRSRKVSKEMAQSDGKMHVCVGYTAPNAHSLHVEGQLAPATTPAPTPAGHDGGGLGIQTSNGKNLIKTKTKRKSTVEWTGNQGDTRHSNHFSQRPEKPV